MGTSGTVPANADNNTYTVNIDLSYSGSCNGDNGLVTSFTTITCYSNGIQLQWTAPSDSGCTVTSYDVRYSTSEITEGNWASASQATGEPTPQVPFSTETFTVSGLSACTLYYFGIKAQIRSGSYSPLATNCGGTLCQGSSQCRVTCE